MTEITQQWRRATSNMQKLMIQSARTLLAWKNQEHEEKQQSEQDTATEQRRKEQTMPTRVHVQQTEHDKQNHEPRAILRSADRLDKGKHDSLQHDTIVTNDTDGIDSLTNEDDSSENNQVQSHTDGTATYQPADNRRRVQWCKDIRTTYTSTRIHHEHTNGKQPKKVKASRPVAAGWQDSDTAIQKARARAVHKAQQRRHRQATTWLTVI